MTELVEGSFCLLANTVVNEAPEIIFKVKKRKKRPLFNYPTDRFGVKQGGGGRRGVSRVGGKGSRFHDI